jgi:hypothetical protein
MTRHDMNPDPFINRTVLRLKIYKIKQARYRTTTFFNDTHLIKIVLNLSLKFLHASIKLQANQGYPF